MAQIKHIASNIIFIVTETPVFKGGVWECGDQRFTDPQKTLYEIVVTVIPVTVSVIGFKLLFTISERVAINAARASNPIIDDFYQLLDDVRTENVDLSLTAVQEMLAYLVTQGLLSTERKDAILAYSPA